METPPEITLADAALRVTLTPANGFSLSSLVDLASGADALWRRPGFSPAPGSRMLGLSGEPSGETFLDLFAGGWFEMFPEVGYTAEDDVASFVHGEAMRLPWDVVEAGPAHAEARVACVRRPLTLTRRVAIEDGRLHVRERIANAGAGPVPYTWGHHPCFARETFAGGRLEIAVAGAEVPDPWFDEANATLAHGPFAWPHAPVRAAGAAGTTIDLGAIPPAADGRHDHACLALAAGAFRLTAPSAGPAGRALRVAFDVEQFPHVLLWECFGAGDGPPFFGGLDTFGVEFSTTPGRSTPDALAAGAVRTLAPGETVETAWSVGWEAI
jgi:galactose mutarotase-like enzyme